MVLPGHIAGGYLTALTILEVLHPEFTPIQTNILLLIGTCAGELPDIDLFFFNWKYRHHKITNESKNDSHRNYITHVPFFWLCLTLFIVVTGYIFNSLFIEYIGWMILAGTWSHFILDSIEYGIHWLAPWSKKRIALKREIPETPHDDRPGSIIQHIHFLVRTYWKMSTFWVEILITSVALYVFYLSR